MSRWKPNGKENTPHWNLDSNILDYFQKHFRGVKRSNTGQTLPTDTGVENGAMLFKGTLFTPADVKESCAFIQWQNMHTEKQNPTGETEQMKAPCVCITPLT